MNIAELIKKLQEINKKYGDVGVYFTDGDRFRKVTMPLVQSPLNEKLDETYVEII